MKRRITDWLRSAELPRNLYELLGHPHLDSDRNALLQTLRTANRELLDYQSHPEPAIAKRAIMLLTELGRARGILEDPERHQAYLADEAKRLKEQFIGERGPLAIRAGNDLSQWLMAGHGLDATRAAAVAALIRGPDEPPPAVLPKPDRSKFGAFASAPAASPIPEVLTLIEASKPEPQPIAPEKPPPTEPLPATLRRAERATPKKHLRPSAEPRKPEGSLFVPIVVACSVLGLSLAASIAIAMVRNEPDEVALTVAEVTPELPPKPEQEPEPAPMQPDPTPVPPLPKPKADPEPKPEPKAVITPEPKPKTVPTPEPKPPEPKPPEPETRPDPVPKVDPPTPPKPKFDETRWTKVAGGKDGLRVYDVLVRVDSIEITRMNQIGSGLTDPVMLIWIELANRGDELRQYKRWMNWTSPSADFYDDYCKLVDVKTGKPVRKPFWLASRHQFKELPNWNDESNVERQLTPGKQLRVPLVFEPPIGSDSREFSLTLKASRLLTKDIGLGKEDEFGIYNLRIGPADWKKPAPR